MWRRIYLEKSRALVPSFRNLSVGEGFLQPFPERSQDSTKELGRISRSYSVTERHTKESLPYARRGCTANQHILANHRPLNYQLNEEVENIEQTLP